MHELHIVPVGWIATSADRNDFVDDFAPLVWPLQTLVDRPSAKMVGVVVCLDSRAVPVVFVGLVFPSAFVDRHDEFPHGFAIFATCRSATGANAIGNFLIEIGTPAIGLAAYFESRKDDKK